MSASLFAIALAALSAPSPLQDSWKKPYTITDLPATVVAFCSELPAEGEGKLWREGDLLKAVYRGKADSVRLTGGIQEPMTRFKDSDVWGVQFQYGEWDRALVAYAFQAEPMPAGFKFQFKNWTGPEGPRIPAGVEILEGRMVDKSFKTDLLEHEGKVHVYVPPGESRDLAYVVMADGQAAEAYAKSLEPLILSQKVRPLAIIGIESGPYFGDFKDGYDMNKDYRAKEYLSQADPQTFANHLKWVTEEVIPWARNEFHLSGQREDAGIFGFSNGGSFAVEAAGRRADVFGLAFPFSAGFPPEHQHSAGPVARFYFAAGALESFSARTKLAVEAVKKWGAEAEYEEYIAGHDSTMWQVAFLKAVQKAFPPKHPQNSTR